MISRGKKVVSILYIYTGSGQNFLVVARSGLPADRGLIGGDADEGGDFCPGHGWLDTVLGSEFPSIDEDVEGGRVVFVVGGHGFIGPCLVAKGVYTLAYSMLRCGIHKQYEQVVKRISHGHPFRTHPRGP